MFDLPRFWYSLKAARFMPLLCSRVRARENRERREKRENSEREREKSEREREM